VATKKKRPRSSGQGVGRDDLANAERRTPCSEELVPALDDEGALAVRFLALVQCE
jgi:hypothetical protein